MGKASSGCVLLCALAFTFVVAHSQSQAGFISIDCGASEEYSDKSTGLYYTTDKSYIKTGENHEVQPMYKATVVNQTQFNNVRSFPNGTRNCYTLKHQPGTNGTKYLIRTRFMYGDYDFLSSPPVFDLYLGVNLWSTIVMVDPTMSLVVSKELVTILTSNVTYICLVNTGLGTPFISAIELRPLISTAYETPSNTIELFARLDFGSEDKSTRFPNDIYDREWKPFKNYKLPMNTLSTNLSFDVDGKVDFFPAASAVMATAVSPQNVSELIGFFWKPSDIKNRYYSYFYFGETQELLPNQRRELVVKLNGDGKNALRITPNYLYSTVVYDDRPTRREWFNYTIERTANSTLPPIINALEVFIAKEFLQLDTDNDDVSAMKNIQATYGVVRDWVADPCAPQNHTWAGVECSYNDNDSPRIISLNLTSSGLTGNISEYIGGLKLLQRLDLSNNNLSGSIPDFLSMITSLTLLNLSGNNLTGTIPAILTAKAQQGSLLLSVEGNGLCLNDSCNGTIKSLKTKKSSISSPLVLVVISLLVASVLVAGIVIFSFRKAKTNTKTQKGTRKDIIGNDAKTASGLLSNNCTTETSYSDDQSYKRDLSLTLNPRNRKFTFSDVILMTNNLERLIGQGGFGKVYYGNLTDNTEVAVKVLDPSLSREGYRQFHTEAEILMKVYHANLASMIGYCHEKEHLCVVYELMENGNLEDYLSPEKNSKFPSWEERLQMALDAAQGLEYLHHGCKPPIVHRDVKSTNILLNKGLQAKVADFGISKIFPDDKCTHVSTAIKGTPGYLDPELFNCLFLNEKSDVYAFGIVLYEIITGRRAIINTGQCERENITSWVDNIIATKGDVRTAVDSRLLKNYDVNSAWKLVETATACISAPASRRPTMHQVVIDLKQCLEMEKSRQYRGYGNDGVSPTGSVNQYMMLPIINASSGPTAR